MKKHHANPHSGWQMIRSRFEMKSPEYHSKAVPLHWPFQSIINYSCNRINKGAILVLLYLFRFHPLVSTNIRFWKEFYMHIQNANKVNWHSMFVNLLMPNDDYSGRTAPLTSKCCILYIYSTNIGTEYFKHGIHSPFFFSLSLQNAVCFIILTYLVPVLFTFNIQDVLKFKKNSGAKRLTEREWQVTSVALRIIWSFRGDWMP